MFDCVLIANRGAISCRIIRTLKRLGIRSVAIYSKVDSGSLHVTAADVTVCIGEAAADTYLNISRILAAAAQTGAQAIHPGYGFLSENAEFAAACEAAGIAFLGPTPEQIRAFGLKNTARDIAVACGAPILPGTSLLASAEEAIEKAAGIGYPVMLKSAGGGGGIGMRRCNNEAELRDAYESVRYLSESHFKGSGMFLEKFIANARHIEVQTFGDGAGNVLALGERDCSVQRRNQKVIEETPAPHLRPDVRAALQRTAKRIMASVQYRSAGTVEFLYDSDTENFYFLEVNSRLQVEHGVTEEVWKVDIVEWMVRLGDASLPPLASLQLHPRGHAIQVRLYAEDPLRDFEPASGQITKFVHPNQVRCDTWIETGTEVSPFYDPLLAKIVVHDDTRSHALSGLQLALFETQLYGIASNLSFLRAISYDSMFSVGGVTTSFLNGFSFKPAVAQILQPGVLTTIQQFPGRLGYWAVGVPPSGPMDDLSFRFGNKLLGNPETACGIECTVSGPSLKFLNEARVVITGADMQPRLNGAPVPLWTVIHIPPDSALELRTVNGPGRRSYILVGGGFDAPSYLGSSTTFTLGKFGGHAGRQLRAGDTIPILPDDDVPPVAKVLEFVPELTTEWQLGVLYGPHGSPDFFTEEDIQTFFSFSWRVHHNSSRTGVRLIGPKPRWARQDGGDAGLHPSNLHDNAYAVGAVDFTGDMPVLLGPDGPSLGGFVCPAVVAQAELWKLGQLAPSDTVRFRRLTAVESGRIQEAVDIAIRDLATALPELPEESFLPEPAILPANGRDAVCRVSGDRYLLIEFGEPMLDIRLRLRAHAVMTALEARRLAGIIDLTPGIRSLQIHYDSRALTRDALLQAVDETLATLPQADDIAVPSRIVHLPLSWDDPATRLAIERYMASVRADAPWCPSNLEFIRRVNGLDSIDDVHRIVFDASYLVLGLGDVYLGAPVATPLDPRHRLVTTKYNPARTWTPENAVGIGGAYLCVYGMEGPGGYQFVGRTLQMWNTYRATKNFEPGKPWLLRFFDQLRFFPVSADELLQMRRDFPLGRCEVMVEESTFRLSEYTSYLESIRSDSLTFRTKQMQAFAAERQRWQDRGEFEESADVQEPEGAASSTNIPVGCEAVTSPTTASVWRMDVQPGHKFESGQRLLMLEAMKMEIAVTAPFGGEVVEVLCAPGTLVSAGQPLVVYRRSD
ncbi:MAG TPA: urea carboxylase [Bryobacteraceae bacterium]|nr:urea carboxylase [Bryobacteraceae bacterium]